MPSKKKKKSCPFSKPKKSCSKDRAEILAESDKGSYYNQEEWLNEQSELSGQSVSTPGSSSASRSKIWVEEPDQVGDDSETWQKLNGHAFISGEKLQEQLDEAVTCRFCQGSMQLLENVENNNELGSIWIVQCQKESCSSRQTNLAFSTTESTASSPLVLVSREGALSAQRDWSEEKQTTFSRLSLSPPPLTPSSFYCAPLFRSTSRLSRKGLLAV